VRPAQPAPILSGEAVDVDEPMAGEAEAPAPDAVDGSAAEPTGVAAVDSALERLADLEGTPVESHVEIFDDVQRQLHEALAELEE
jgi:hypothetical protein